MQCKITFQVKLTFRSKFNNISQLKDVTYKLESQKKIKLRLIKILGLG